MRKIVIAAGVAVVFVIGVALYALGFSGLGPSLLRPDSRNVIIISIDTLRADHLGLYGYSRDTSPNLDKFSKEALVFDQAIAQAPFTLSSHASILTSQYPPVHGLLGLEDVLAPSKLTLAEVLSSNGYQTAAFVGDGELESRFGFSQGFDSYIDNGGEYLETTIPLAEAWLKSQRKGRFFLYLQGYDVHGPYEKPEPYGKMFTDPNYAGVLSDKTKYRLDYQESEPRSVLQKIMKLNGKPVLVEDDGSSAPLTQEDVEYIIASYDGGVRHTDNLIGGFFDELKRMGLYDNSIIIVLAGHGESLGDDLAREAEPSSSRLFGHGQVYDELIRAPLLIKVPGLEPARISSSVQLIDLFPTILDFLGIPQSRELKSGIQGRSLTSVISGKESQEFAYGTMGSRGGLNFVRTLEWKLIRLGENAFQLYDLKVDPKETTDVSAEHEDVASEFKKNLFEWSFKNLEKRAEP